MSFAGNGKKWRDALLLLHNLAKKVCWVISNRHSHKMWMLSVLPFYNFGGLRYWVSVQQTQRLLRYIVPREATKKNEIGVAGSSPLYWYQEKYQIGPKWTGPNDVDIFVAGYWGRSRERFEILVDLMEERIVGAGYKCTRKDKFHPYACRSGLIRITDFAIKGLNQVVSFVQHPECDSVQEVARGFDISVCKVVYHIHQQRFETMHGTHRDIVRCQFYVHPLEITSPGKPTNFERGKWVSTDGRCAKYRRRGFELMNKDEILVWYERKYCGF